MDGKWACRRINLLLVSQKSPNYFFLVIYLFFYFIFEIFLQPCACSGYSILKQSVFSVINIIMFK